MADLGGFNSGGGRENITFGDLYRSHVRTREQLKVVREQLKDHEKRLRRAEKWMYALPPTIVVSGAAIVIAIIRGGP